MARTILVDQIASPLIIVNQQGVIEQFSSTLWQYFGIHESPEGRLLSDIFNESSLSIKALCAPNPAPQELILHDQQSQAHHFFVSVLPFENDGQPAGQVFIFNELPFVREFELAESEEILYEHRLLRTLLDLLPENIYVKNRESQFQFLNSEAIRRLGVNLQGNLLGKTDFDFLPHDLAEQFFREEQHIMETGEALVNREAYYESPSEQIWFTDTKVPFRNVNGEIIGLVGITRNVTAQKQVEQALAAERALFRNLIDVIPDYIYIKDLESRFTLGNKAIIRDVGSTEETDLIGKSDFDFQPREVAQGYYETEQRVLQHGERIINFEELTNSSNGDKSWILSTKVPIYDANGKITGLVGVGRNITAEKRAELALAEERNLLRTILETIPDYVFAKDTEGRFWFANEASLKGFGFSSFDEVEGKTDFDFLPSHQAQHYFDEEQAILRGGAPMLNQAQVSDTEKYGFRWINMTKVPLPNVDGTIRGLLCVYRDITQQKLAEQALEAHHHLLQSVIDHLPDFVYVKDLEGRYILDNLAHALSVGLTPPEMVDKRDFDLFPPEMAQGFFKDDMQVCESGKAIRNREELSFNVDQKITWVISNKIPLRDSEGKIVGMIGQTYDITERKLAEKQAFELATEKERVKMLTEFIRDVAHDFRTPLSIINTSLYLLERSRDEEQRKAHLNKIQDGSTNLEKLIERMMMMMKFDISNTARRVSANINTLLRQVTTKLTPEAQQKQITLQQELGHELPALVLDLEEIKQALHEILENAIIYTPEGGSITSGTRLQGHEIVISIQDNGAGISESDLPHIFERLYRADKARTSISGRAGLGLPIARKIIENHGGHIGVQSQLNAGSLFEIWLPVAEAPAATADA